MGRLRRSAGGYKKREKVVVRKKVPAGQKVVVKKKVPAGQRTVVRKKVPAGQKAPPFPKTSKPKKPVVASTKKGKSTVVKSVKTKGGNYPVYKKKSSSAVSFRKAFAAARKSGKKIFTWEGRKYTTKVKK